MSSETTDTDSKSMFCAACNKTIKRGTYAFVVRYSRMNVKTAGRRDETALCCSARCLIQYGTDIEFDAIIENDKTLESVEEDDSD